MFPPSFLTQFVETQCTAGSLSCRFPFPSICGVSLPDPKAVKPWDVRNWPRCCVLETCCAAASLVVHECPAEG